MHEIMTKVSTSNARAQKIYKRDIIILLGDLSAKVGQDNTGKKNFMGKHSLGIMNSNG